LEDGHKGKCVKEEVSSTEGVDCPYCGNGEEEVDDTEPHAKQQGRLIRVVRVFLQDCRGIVSGDVYTAKLLEEHGYHGGGQCTTVSAKGEEFGEGFLMLHDLSFLLEEVINEEKVAACLELGVPQFTERHEGFFVLLCVTLAGFLEKPAWGLGEGVDVCDDKEREDHLKLSVSHPLHEFEKSENGVNLQDSLASIASLDYI
jgi:hypothetical protein